MSMRRFSIERRILLVSLATLVLIWIGGMGYLYLDLTHEIDELAPHLFPGQDAVEHTEELREALVTAVFYPLLAGLPLLAGALLMVIYTGFRPIRELKQTIESQDPAALKPLPTDQLPTELMPMVSALNKLFVKTSDLVAREKRLTADAAHELRTPLATIQVNAQSLQALAPPHSEQITILNDLLAGCERAKRAIDQMLALARLDHDLQSDHAQRLDLAELIRQEIAALLPLAHQKSIQVQLEMPETLSIKTREALIRATLSNLLSNAIKFTPPSGQVMIRLESGGSMALIQIEDSGPGLTADQTLRLGERFFRVDPNKPGTGLGWSIIRQCTELLGGQIRVSPQASLGGLLVELKIPLAQQQF
jgi:two-component system sensor histidine kinase QseC